MMIERGGAGGGWRTDEEPLEAFVIEPVLHNYSSRYRGDADNFTM